MARKNKTRGHFPRMDAQTAIDIADGADLPDGAYVALIGDLMGGDYMTGVEALIGYTGPVAHQITKAERAALEPFGEIRVCSEWHFQIRAKGGKPVLADWWPHRTKFRLAGGSRTEMGDGLYLAKQLRRALDRNNQSTAQQSAAPLIAAARQVIEMNRQEALDRLGDAEKAEGWACVRTLREGLLAIGAK